LKIVCCLWFVVESEKSGKWKVESGEWDPGVVAEIIKI
jgi:hypothetical protein